MRIGYIGVDLIVNTIRPNFANRVKYKANEITSVNVIYDPIVAVSGRPSNDSISRIFSKDRPLTFRVAFPSESEPSSIVSTIMIL